MRAVDSKHLVTKIRRCEGKQRRIDRFETKKRYRPSGKVSVLHFSIEASNCELRSTSETVKQQLVARERATSGDIPNLIGSPRLCNSSTRLRNIPCSSHRPVRLKRRTRADRYGITYIEAPTGDIRRRFCLAVGHITLPSSRSRGEPRKPSQRVFHGILWCFEGVGREAALLVGSVDHGLKTKHYTTDGKGVFGSYEIQPPRSTD